LDLKFHISAPITLAVVAVTSQNFTGKVARGRGDQVYTNFTRCAPYKFCEGKNVQNSVRFLTTFDFDREYLRNALMCRKSDWHLINYISSRIRRKKFGQLWSTNQKVIDAHVDPPNWTFFWRLYFGP